MMRGREWRFALIGVGLAVGLGLGSWASLGSWTSLGCLAASAQSIPKAGLAPDPASISGIEPDLPKSAAEEVGLRRDLAAHPGSAEILYRLALTLRLENKPKESLAMYTQAAQARKPDADELRSVALDYVLLDDYEDAVHWLEVAAAADPRNSEVLYSLGRCLYTQGHYREAEEKYLQVLAMEPHHLKAEENLGLAYDADNQPEKAEAALRLAAEWARSQRSDEWPLLNLGSYLLDHDKAVEAAGILAEAVVIAPKSAVCHEKYGRALEESDKQLAAMKELEAAVALDPKNPNIHFELGHVYREVGEHEKARAEFATSQELRKERDRK